MGSTTQMLPIAIPLAAILALWGIALHRRHPRAPAMVVALAASVLAGCVRALPADVTCVVGLDPTSLYHVAQIPAMVLLFTALAGVPAPVLSLRWSSPDRGGA